MSGARSAQVAAGIAAGLRDAGVQRIFGMPGGGPNLDLIGAAQAQGIDFVLAHGETAACIMASAFGRLTGTVGVAVVTRGPGATSAANGLAQATLDRFPLLLLTDTVWQADRHRVAHQRLDQVAAAAPLAKWSGVLGATDPARVVAGAARLALGAPQGAVHLAVDPTVPGDRPPAPAAAVRPTAEELDRARAVLAAARRPVVLVGVDARRYPADVRAALGPLDCPVLVTYEAAGVIPQSWPTYAGLFTGAAIERAVLDQADVVLGIGLDPVEPMPGGWPYDVPVVLFGTHEQEGGYFGEPVLVTGSPADDLPPLVGACRSDWTPGAGVSAHRAGLAALDPRDREPGDSGTVGLGPDAGTVRLTPQDLVRLVRDHLGDAVLTVDAGAHMLVAMPLWSVEEPDRVLISNGLATMGFALPASIGAAFARPGEPVVCLVGDGGIGMVLAELETLARCRLDVTVVVFNDATLSLIKLKQGAGQGGEPAVGYAPIDFAAVAEGLGLQAAVVTTPAALSDLLGGVSGGSDVHRDGTRSAGGRPWPARGPRLVDARVDPSGYLEVLRTIRG